MKHFSLTNYTMVNQNRRLSRPTHGDLITYIHNDFGYRELNNELPSTSSTSTLFESLVLDPSQT